MRKSPSWELTGMGFLSRQGQLANSPPFQRWDDEKPRPSESRRDGSRPNDDVERPSRTGLFTVFVPTVETAGYVPTSLRDEKPILVSLLGGDFPYENLWNRFQKAQIMAMLYLYHNGFPVHHLPKGLYEIY
jgi:hypothetical protein